MAFALLFAFSSGINAKNDPAKINVNNSGMQFGIGDIMGQLIGGLKTNSFSDGKTGKNDLLGMIGGIGSSDYLKYASLAGSLAGALKGSAFLPDWANQKDGILDKLQTAGNIADVAGGVSGILGFINPKSFKSKGKQSSLITALGLLSKFK